MKQMAKKTKIGVLGSTGYTGVVLVKLLMNHPNINLVYLASEQYADKKYSDVYQTFYGILENKCKKTDANKIANECDVVFMATPHGFSKDFIPKLLEKNEKLRIIDLSADFRLETKFKNKIRVIYGLPELYRSQIKKSQFIANPGCYPTSAILALAPALKNGLIKQNSIIIDSKSGTSGAGKQAKAELHFCEINESFSPYALAGKHRHLPEIENELSKLSGKKTEVTFSPHLLPINRGILSTIYADLKTEISQKEIYDLYKSHYKNEYFVKVLPENVYANTKNVRYTNFCHLTPLKDEKTNRLILVSSIDNMVKGASGQAIQNMNLMLGLNERMGLDTVGQTP